MMNGITATVLAILTLVLPSYSQNKPPGTDQKSAPEAKGAPKPEKQSFYYHSWDKGEYKVCQTYSGAPNVILCDSADDVTWKGSFLNLIAENNRLDKPEDESYRLALAFASQHGKTFVASFSEDPWPKPQTGFKMSIWSCSKDKTGISCSLSTRGAKTAIGE